MAIALAGAPAACSSQGASDEESTESSEDAVTSSAVGSSFASIKQKVYAKPLARLPNRVGLQAMDMVKNLVGSEDKPKHELSIRSRRILVDKADERNEGEKWLHPRGACASARWKIDTTSPATGLFAKGSNVPAIVRVSSGDKRSVGGDPDNGRILGIAVKLFPTSSETQRVTTRNIIMLDQYGFERSSRKHTWLENDGAPVYFTNVAPAKSAVGKFLSTFFDRFDQPNWARPVYATARAAGGNDDLPSPVTPYEIRFRATRGTPSPADAASDDFRGELATEGSVTLDIILQSLEPTRAVALRIGSLELDEFVVSDFCDLSLRFHHDPIEDQLEKYKDYAVVKDLMP